MPGHAGEIEARRKDWNNVLIVTGGSTPQVVTETIYALATRSRDPFVPAKIICTVTKGVADLFGNPFEIALDRLKSELAITENWERSYRDARSGRTGLFIQYPRDAADQPIKDIRCDDDAVRFANLVSEIVQSESADSNSRIHLSLAGGRKTMSFHGGAALSLFGRTQDELSHVLVHPQDFEGCADFWFRTKAHCQVTHRDGRVLDAQDARLELSNIPFLRVRDFIPHHLISNRMDYNDYVAQTNAALGRVPLSLELTTADQRVHIGNIPDFTLPNTEFALYQLMAEWKQNDRKGAGPFGIGPDHRGWLTARMFECPEEYAPNPVARFIEIYDETFKTGVKRPEALQLTVKPHLEIQRKTNGKCLREWKSRLLGKLHERLHLADLADRFGAPHSEVECREKRVFDGKAKTVRVVVFGLRLLPSEIIINRG